jgi:peptide/nickel transport system substrate-binding protein
MAILIFWTRLFYFDFTREIPKVGGEYIEGIIGQPLYINPLISQTSEADEDLTQLIYSGLFKYDKDGNIVPDLAESYSISEDKKEYTVILRQGVTWHDKQSLNVQDIFFTYNILQDPAYKSPLRINFQGVDAVRVVDDRTIIFSLKNAYAGFLVNLTVGILPKHIWENIAPEKFSLAEYNLRPIGSGPYVFSDLQKNSDGTILTFKLSAFKNYYDTVPYISKITFNFYLDDTTLIDAYNKKEIMGMSSLPPQNIQSIKNIKSTNINQIAIPRYFSVFLNRTKSVALANDEVRKALDMSVDRQAIIGEVFYGKGIPLKSPFFPQMEGYIEQNMQTDIEGANKLLETAGWTMDTNENMRKKNGTPLEFELLLADYPELVQTVNLLKEQWAKIGARVNIKVLTVSDLQQNHIRTREYDSLLLGQAMNFNPDLYSFWHSDQRRDQGLNMSSLDNKNMDELVLSLRQEFDQNKRIENYKKFQEILAQEVPAVFLYARCYLYPTSTSVHGIDVRNINNPQQRFTDVNKWYVKTSRVLKK